MNQIFLLLTKIHILQIMILQWVNFKQQILLWKEKHSLIIRIIIVHQVHTTYLAL